MSKPLEHSTLNTAYAWTCHPQMSPVWLNFVCQLVGIAGPDLDGPFRYCELGCGHGLTSATLAATFPHAHFSAWDINPDHIRSAKGLAVGGMLANLTAYHDDFRAAADRADQYDYIAAQGIFSWIDARARADFLKAIDHTLADGGVLYLNYNLESGWAAMAPLRHALLILADEIDGSLTDKAQHALTRMSAIRDQGGLFFRQSQNVSQLFNLICRMDIDYVVHELFGPHQFFRFSDIQAMLEPLGLVYAGTLPLHQNLLKYCLGSGVYEFLPPVEKPVHLQDMADFLRQARMRQDVWVRKPRLLSDDALAARQLAQRYALNRFGRDLETIGQLPGASIDYQQPLLQALFSALSDRACSITELLALPAFARTEWSELVDILNLLCAAETIVPVRHPGAVAPPVHLKPSQLHPLSHYLLTVEPPLPGPLPLVAGTAGHSPILTAQEARTLKACFEQATAAARALDQTGQLGPISAEGNEAANGLANRSIVASAAGQHFLESRIPLLACWGALGYG